jgi:hypothetical protein
VIQKKKRKERKSKDSHKDITLNVDAHPTPARSNIFNTFAGRHHAFHFLSRFFVLAVSIIQNGNATVLFLSVTNHLTCLFSLAAQLVAGLPFACKPHRADFSFIARRLCRWLVSGQFKANVVVNDTHGPGGRENLLT